MEDERWLNERILALRVEVEEIRLQIAKSLNIEEVEVLQDMIKSFSSAIEIFTIKKRKQISEPKSDIKID